MTYFMKIYAASKKTGRLQRGIGFALLLCVALFSLPAAHTQILYGSLTGTITDASNAVVPNVSVELTNQATGASRTVTTDSHGDYLALNLEPGPYTIAIKQAGFAAFTQKNILVVINQEQRVNILLQLGSV